MTFFEITKKRFALREIFRGRVRVLLSSISVEHFKKWELTSNLYFHNKFKCLKNSNLKNKTVKKGGFLD